MKRLSIFCITFLLLCYTGFGQISQNEFDRLVDYVNVYYLKAYIDKKISENDKSFSNTYISNYQIKIKPIWENYLEDSSISNIIIHINDFGNHDKAKMLYETISRKKEGYTSFEEKALINFLISLPDTLPSRKKEGFKGYLKNETKELKTKLEEIIKNKFRKGENETVTEPTTGRSGAITQKKNVERPERNNPGYNLNFLNIGLLILIAITLLLIIIYRKKFINLIQQYLKMKPNNSKIDGAQSLEAKVKELQFENLRLRGLENDNAQLHLKNKQLELRVRELEKQLEEFNESTIQNVLFPSVSGINQVSHSINDRLYAEAIVEGAFYGLSEKPNADTVYELLLSENGKNASFRIYTEAYKRVIKNPDFVDGCDKQKVNTTPQDLDVETGTASQDDFGKWKVTKKAIIIFK